MVVNSWVDQRNLHVLVGKENNVICRPSFVSPLGFVPGMPEVIEDYGQFSAKGHFAHYNDHLGESRLEITQDEAGLFCAM